MEFFHQPCRSCSKRLNDHPVYHPNYVVSHPHVISPWVIIFVNPKYFHGGGGIAYGKRRGLSETPMETFHGASLGSATKPASSACILHVLLYMRLRLHRSKVHRDESGTMQLLRLSERGPRKTYHSPPAKEARYGRGRTIFFLGLLTLRSSILLL